MATTVDDVNRRIRALTVSRDVSSPQLGAAQKELKQANDQLNCNDEGVASLQSLKTSADALASAATVLNDTSNRFIVVHISSQDGRTPSVTKLLQHFKQEIHSIVKASLNTKVDESCNFCSIIQECFNQAVVPSETLDSENYFIELEETYLGSPYDEDFESEEYYEHENRLEVDEAYAEAEHKRQEREYERRRADRKRTHEEWTKYWLEALHKCEGGPTLFWPPATREFDNHFANIPQYLFRVFDTGSSGRNDDGVIASMASVYNEPEVSKRDILSLEQNEATEMLLDHFKKSFFHGQDNDNLMSWSNSLLFLTQYAIMRSQWRPASEVYICAVETCKFPRGQFAQDLALIEACRNKKAKNEEMEDFVRLRKSDYDNGEFVSQGLVDIKYHSSVTDLQALIDNGLYELYPDFDDPVGRSKWTNRVRDLRRCWDVPCTTTSEEIEIAFQLASTCFPDCEAIDMALQLLTFKNRKLQESSHTQSLLVQQRMKSYEKSGPSEVQRYAEAKEITQTPNLGQTGLGSVSGSHSRGIRILESLFELA